VELGQSAFAGRSSLQSISRLSAIGKIARACFDGCNLSHLDEFAWRLCITSIDLYSVFN
jgi:hypothetical protein